MSKRLPVVLTQAETDAIILAARNAADNARTAKKQWAAWRDFVMVQTGLRAGPRVSELCNLTLSDVNLANAVLAIRGGKGDKDRNVPFGPALLGILRKWIGDRKDGYLFPGPNGKRLNPRTFQVRLDALAAAARIVKEIHPHLLRHSYACWLLRNGVDIREVMELMGHANLNTTEVYLHVDQNHLRETVNRLG